MWPYLIIGMGVLLGIYWYDLRLPRLTSEQHPDRPLYGIPDRAERQDTPRLVLFWAIIGALILISGLRFRVGIDTISHQECFRQAPLLSDLSLDAIGRRAGGRHAILYSISKSIGCGIWLVQFVCTLILNLAFGRFIVRYSRRWFTCLGIYLCVSYIFLNFEVMYQGAATGLLIWSFDDLCQRRYRSFYLKLLGAACFHLSVLSLAWLPLLTCRRMRKLTDSTLFLPMLTAALLALGFGVKYLLVNQIHNLDGIPLFDTLHFNSAGIQEGFADHLSGLGLNWKGIIRRLLIYAAIPIATYIALTRSQNDADFGDADTRRAFRIILATLAAFEILAIWLNVFVRLGFYLLPLAIPAFANSLSTIAGRTKRICWWATTAAASFLVLYHFNSATQLTRQGHLYEFYIPYASWIDKGLSHHREWLNYSLMCAQHDDPYPDEHEFYYDLDPGTHYIDPPIGGQHLIPGCQGTK